MSGAAYAFYEYVAESEYFRVRTICVAGAETLDGEAIAARSELTTADNILFVKADAVAARVASLPYVKSCTVARVFPGVVEIALTERKAAATLLVHNRSFAVDAEGVVLEELAASDPHPGPFITEVPGLDVVEVGQDLDLASLDKGLSVLEAFATTAMAKEVTVAEIAAHRENDVRMYCDELSFEIRWGRGDLEAQAKRLDMLWAHKGKDLDCDEYCDLRFGRDVACR